SREPRAPSPRICGIRVESCNAFGLCAWFVSTPPSSAVVRRIGYSCNRLRSEIARNISFSRALIRNVRSALADFGCRALRLPRQQCRHVAPQLHKATEDELDRLYTSVVRHTDGRLLRAARPRFTFSRISDALAVQINSLGALLCSARETMIVVTSSLTL